MNVITKSINFSIILQTYDFTAYERVFKFNDWRDTVKCTNTIKWAIVEVKVAHE